MNAKHVLKRLEIPTQEVSSKTNFKHTLLVTLNEIKSRKSAFFKEIREIQDGYSRLIYLLAACSKESSLSWWTDSFICSAAQECIYYTSQFYNEDNNVSDIDFMALIFLEIFEKHIKPNFQSTSRAVVNGKIRNIVSHDDYDDSPPWKSKDVGCVPAYTWLLENAGKPTLEQRYLDSIPIILTLVEDYDICYKKAGLNLILLVARKADIGSLKKTGVSELFIQAVDKLLVLRRESGGDKLLNYSIKCYLELVQSFYNPKSAEMTDKLFHLFYTAIVQNLAYVGNEFSFMITVLSNIKPLAQNLGVNTVRYLKPLVEEIIPILELEILGVETVVELQAEAATALLTLLQVCSPRVDSYSEQILPAIVLCYDSAKSPLNKKLPIMGNLLNQLGEIFQLILSLSSPQTKKFVEQLEMEYPNMKQKLSGIASDHSSK